MGRSRETLVLAGTGKTGRRVVQRLKIRGITTRVGSRSGTPSFDWEDESTWVPALRGVHSVYVVYTPDVAMPAAPAAISAFSERAVKSGVRRLVLLSGRGEEEAQRCEGIVRDAGAEWTIVRSSWFNQNFSEGAFRDLVLSGTVALPAGEVAEPFVDADDIADVAIAALAEDRHVGEVYEVTGPSSLTFAEAVREIAEASRRDIRFVRASPEEFAAGLAAEGVPAEIVELLRYLFGTVLDGRNTQPTDGVERALGRAPRSFRDYARAAAAAGAWRHGVTAGR
jgi:uncharacterized protein YbjT (DUF2867 family)